MEQHQYRQNSLQDRKFVPYGPGCPFIRIYTGVAGRCQSAHNPDTWKIGFRWFVWLDATKKNIREALRFRRSIGSESGCVSCPVVVRPLLQMDFLIRLFKKAKGTRHSYNLNTVWQAFDSENHSQVQIYELISITDYSIWNINHMITATIKTRLTNAKQ